MPKFLFPEAAARSPRQRPLSYSLPTAFLLCCCAFGCQSANVASTSTPVVEHEELAPHMAQLQRFSQKAGFAIAAQNQALALFYVQELTEALDELGEIEVVEEMPIGGPAKVIMSPLMADLKQALEAIALSSASAKQSPTWNSVGSKYSALIDGCNRCHAATEHEYIKITPAPRSAKNWRVENPFNQDFSK